MRKRSKARECALQILYQVDIRNEPYPEICTQFWSENELPRDMREFANDLVVGTRSRLKDIDPFISKHADNWDMSRMAVVDRNILRLGVYELVFGQDVPPSVCINEAIELAKRYGDAESAKFVNGILDAIHKSGPKKLRNKAS